MSGPSHVVPPTASSTDTDLDTHDVNHPSPSHTLLSPAPAVKKFMRDAHGSRTIRAGSEKHETGAAE